VLGKNWRNLIIFYFGIDTVLQVLHEIGRLLNRIQPYYKNNRQRKRCKRHFADVSVTPATIICASFANANGFIEYPDDRGKSRGGFVDVVATGSISREASVAIASVRKLQR